MESIFVIKWRKENSDQTNKQERDRNPPYKQDYVLLFTINKDNWPIRREYLSHMTIIRQVITKISSFVQAWFLHSVNIYKYDI